mmetsp:Transcript_75045/g.229627  ORF Transcript_75045/g.229627 Transcript_75045/m.229627 type:complete len:210 (-) Transcript_75045:126-755(-)
MPKERVAPLKDDPFKVMTAVCAPCALLNRTSPIMVPAPLPPPNMPAPNPAPPAMGLNAFTTGLKPLAAAEPKPPPLPPFCIVCIVCIICIICIICDICVCMAWSVAASPPLPLPLAPLPLPLPLASADVCTKATVPQWPKWSFSSCHSRPAGTLDTASLHPSVDVVSSTTWISPPPSMLPFSACAAAWAACASSKRTSAVMLPDVVTSQ